MRGLFQSRPKHGFKADRGLMPRDGDGPFNGGLKVAGHEAGLKRGQD